MPNLFQVNMKAETQCLEEMMEFFIEIGKPRQLPRKVLVKTYKDCLKKLGKHYSTVSDAIRALYKVIPEHSAFPRYNARVPMAFRDAREHEASLGKGGIVTGYNKFQGWANKHKASFSKIISEGDEIETY